MIKDKCGKIDKDTKPLNSMQAINLLDHLSDKWSINIDDKLFCSLKFKNYKDPLDFVLKISKLAEKQDHHPDIAFGWGYVEITLYSHILSGLHENDFIMASEIDKVIKKDSAKII